MRMKSLKIGYIITGILLLLAAASIVGSIVIPHSVQSKYVEPAIADTLIYLRNTSESKLEEGVYPLYMDLVYNDMKSEWGGYTGFELFINSSKGMEVINSTWDYLIPLFSGNENTSLLAIFNENIESMNASRIPGISEAINNTNSMGFNITNALAIINGTSYQDGLSTKYLPGLLQNDFEGQNGIEAFLNLYENPSEYNLNKNNLTQLYFLDNIDQLNAITLWITSIVFEDVVSLMEEQVGYSLPVLNTTTIREYYQLQWSERLFVSSGLQTLDTKYVGFEVNTNFSSYNQLMGIWNSFNNATEVGCWLAAIEGDSTLATHLQNSYSLNTSQYSDIETWFSDLEPYMKSYIEDEYDFDPLLNFYEELFYEQWMYGTVYENGMWNGFEVMFPRALDRSVVVTLWDETNPKAITNSTGIKLWYDIVDNNDHGEYDVLLKDYMANSAKNMEQMINWLHDWRFETFYEITEEYNLIGFSIPFWGKDLKGALNGVTTILAILSVALVLTGMSIIFVRKSREERISP
jgi:hypothetical protein